jgi:hypothetical protein
MGELARNVEEIPLKREALNFIVPTPIGWLWNPISNS